MKAERTTLRLAMHFAMLMLHISLLTDIRAAANDGVRCPNGYETQYDAATKTMRCERSNVQHRPTVCDATFPEFLVYRTAKGRDFCVRAADATAPVAAFIGADAKRKSVVCTGDSAEGVRLQIEVDALDERDRCRTTRTEWIYPSQQ